MARRGGVQEGWLWSLVFRYRQCKSKILIRENFELFWFWAIQRWLRQYPLIFGKKWPGPAGETADPEILRIFEEFRNRAPLGNKRDRFLVPKLQKPIFSRQISGDFSNCKSLLSSRIGRPFRPLGRAHLPYGAPKAFRADFGADFPLCGALRVSIVPSIVFIFRIKHLIFLLLFSTLFLS